MNWTALKIAPAELRIHSTLNCGQSFRWIQSNPNEWTGVIQTHIVSLRQTPSDILFSSPSPPNIVLLLLKRYFQLDVPLEELYTVWKHDVNFSKKHVHLPGLRVLQQDLVETIFAFICSSNNNIQRITSMVSHLSQKYGKYIGEITTLVGQRKMHAFPSVEDLLHSGLELELRDAGFGYRAKYIAQSAHYINNNPTFLADLSTMPCESARSSLRCLMGVGPKVADCICLFALGHHNVVPVDTHVMQIATRDYKFRMKGLSMTPENYRGVQGVFEQVFGEYAGWAHSVLFTADLKKFQDVKGEPVESADSGKVESVKMEGDVKVETMDVDVNAERVNEPDKVKVESAAIEENVKIEKQAIKSEPVANNADFQNSVKPESVSTLATPPDSSAENSVSTVKTTKPFRKKGRKQKAPEPVPIVHQYDVNLQDDFLSGSDSSSDDGRRYESKTTRGGLALYRMIGRKSRRPL